MNIVTLIGIIIAVFVILGIGIFIGRMIEQNKGRSNKIGGVIHVDDSDPEGPYFFLELNEEVDEMIGDGYLKAKVQTEHYISQE